MDRSPASPEWIAYHECGHALMALLLGGQVRRITIEPENDDGPAREGDAQILLPRKGIGKKQFAESTVRVSLAGPVAEMIYSGEPYHPGFVAEWANDWRAAWEAAAGLHADERTRLQYLERTAVELYHRLRQDDLWAALASLADNLLAHETLESEEVEEIVEAWLP